MCVVLLGCNPFEMPTIFPQHHPRVAHTQSHTTNPAAICTAYDIRIPHLYYNRHSWDEREDMPLHVSRTDLDILQMAGGPYGDCVTELRIPRIGEWLAAHPFSLAVEARISLTRFIDRPARIDFPVPCQPIDSGVTQNRGTHRERFGIIELTPKYTDDVGVRCLSPYA